MIRVLATGTFDILHPGHILYLQKAKELGDELYVIVSRDSMVHHKPKPIIPEDQRLKIIQALKVVDSAQLGSESDIYEPLYSIKPDIIVLGFDQHFDEQNLKEQLRHRHIDAEVVRIAHADTGALSGTENIIKRIIETRVQC
jgi:FAD synthetase